MPRVKLVCKQCGTKFSVKKHLSNNYAKFCEECKAIRLKELAKVKYQRYKRRMLARKASGVVPVIESEPEDDGKMNMRDAMRVVELMKRIAF
jgi:endogenous inhibitor of DNA gyrase (YacG/DUF329 family)